MDSSIKGGEIMCKECYSDYSRITPILDPENCLKKHKQYKCSTCGRLICASIDENGRYRALFPFKSLNIAIQYLRVAEVITESKCEIYEIKGKNGRLSYKIFTSYNKLVEYLHKNKNKECIDMAPVYSTTNYTPLKDNQLIILKESEIELYLKEQLLEAKAQT